MPIVTRDDLRMSFSIQTREIDWSTQIYYFFCYIIWFCKCSAFILSCQASQEAAVLLPEINLLIHSQKVLKEYLVLTSKKDAFNPSPHKYSLHIAPTSN